MKRDYSNSAVIIVPRIRKGVIPTLDEKGIPQYSNKPKLDRTARPVDRTPTVATDTLFLTQSNLMHDQIEKLIARA